MSVEDEVCVCDELRHNLEGAKVTISGAEPNLPLHELIGSLRDRTFYASKVQSLTIQETDEIMDGILDARLFNPQRC